MTLDHVSLRDLLRALGKLSLAASIKLGTILIALLSVTIGGTTWVVTHTTDAPEHRVVPGKDVPAPNASIGWLHNINLDLTECMDFARFAFQTANVTLTSTAIETVFGTASGAKVAISCVPGTAMVLVSGYGDNELVALQRDVRRAFESVALR